MKRLLLATALSLATGTAFAQQSAINKIPPAEFDHPFPGPTVVTHRANLDGICPDACACARRVAHVCQIYVNHSNKGRLYFCTWDNDALRHEIGHCNGWGGDHEGSRWNTEELGNSAVFYPGRATYFIKPDMFYEGQLDVRELFLEYGKRRLKEMGE